MAPLQVAAEQQILLFRRPWFAGCHLEIAVPLQRSLLACARLELTRDDADGDAGRAIDATRPIGDALAAAKADPSQRIVELGGMLPCQLREHLPLGLARQIGAGRRRGHEKAGKAEWCAHDAPAGLVGSDFFMRLNTSDGKTRPRQTARKTTSRSTPGRGMWLRLLGEPRLNSRAGNTPTHDAAASRPARSRKRHHPPQGGGPKFPLPEGRATIWFVKGHMRARHGCRVLWR